MNWIKLLFRTSSITLIIGIISGLISGICTTLMIVLINQSINNLSSHNPLGLNRYIVYSFILLCIVRFITDFIAKYCLIYLSENTLATLRIKLSDGILASSLYHLEKIGKNLLLATLTDDLNVLARTTSILPIFIIYTVVLLGCIFYLFLLSPLVFTSFVLFLLIGILSYKIPTNIGFKFFKNSRNQQDKIFANFQGIIEGTKELKLNKEKRINFFNQELKTNVIIYRDNNIWANGLFALTASWGNLLFFIATGLVLFLVPQWDILSFHIISGYVLTIIYLISPLEYIMTALPVITKATVALQKINSLNFELSNYQDNQQLASIENEFTFKSLELSHVDYNYDKDLEGMYFNLQNICLKINKGELVFIIGGNGSGKSTLIKLITGLYQPHQGKIKVNGEDINDNNIESYRQMFAAVFYDFYLFDKLLINYEKISDAQVQEYLKKLHIADKVTINDGKFSTINISSGQRKRLALLLTFIEDRPIYIFDEWASDQDPVYKNIFYTEILPNLQQQGKTVIVVTHDDQYYHVGDRLIKLESGKVIDQ